MTHAGLFSATRKELSGVLLMLQFEWSIEITFQQVC